jgi:hypothetical protein
MAMGDNQKVTVESLFDATGFQKGSKLAQNAMDKLTKFAEKMGSKMKKSGEDSGKGISYAEQKTYDFGETVLGSLTTMDMVGEALQAIPESLMMIAQSGMEMMKKSWDGFWGVLYEGMTSGNRDAQEEMAVLIDSLLGTNYAEVFAEKGGIAGFATGEAFYRKLGTQLSEKDYKTVSDMLATKLATGDFSSVDVAIMEAIGRGDYETAMKAIMLQISGGITDLLGVSIQRGFTESFQTAEGAFREFLKHFDTTGEDISELTKRAYQDMMRMNQEEFEYAMKTSLEEGFLTETEAAALVASRSRGLLAKEYDDMIRGVAKSFGDYLREPANYQGVGTMLYEQIAKEISQYTR